MSMFLFLYASCLLTTAGFVGEMVDVAGGERLSRVGIVNLLATLCTGLVVGLNVN